VRLERGPGCLHGWIFSPLMGLRVREDHDLVREAWKMGDQALVA